MEPNDNQPGGPSSRTITIHLTRDTLLLIAALVFLALAILLAVVFPSASSSTSNPSSTGVALSGTSSPNGRATTAAITGAATPISGGPINTEPNAAIGSANYPAPTDEAAQLEISSTPSAVAGAPIFDPNRTAETTSGQLALAETDYPAPATATVVSRMIHHPRLRMRTARRAVGWLYPPNPSTTNPFPTALPRPYTSPRSLPHVSRHYASEGRR